MKNPSISALSWNEKMNDSYNDLDHVNYQFLSNFRNSVFSRWQSVRLCAIRQPPFPIGISFVERLMFMLVYEAIACVPCVNFSYVDLFSTSIPVVFHQITTNFILQQFDLPILDSILYIVAKAVEPLPLSIGKLYWAAAIHSISPTIWFWVSFT